MAALAGGGTTDDARRAAVSPRPKGRENVKGTLCRNVTIYGHCRYENKGCAFVHRFPRDSNASDNLKKRLNVDSPSFTPSLQSSPSLSVSELNTRSAGGMSMQAANAAPFRPDTYNAGTDASNSFARNQYNPAAADWSLAAATESSTVDPSGGVDQTMYNTFANNMSMANANSLNFTPNPLMNNMQQDTSSAYSQQFFGGGAQQSVQPLQYHLYGSFGPRREDLAPYQRAAQDLFIPDNLREELQKKSHAATQTLQSGIGLLKVGAYHTFVPLEDAFDKSSTTFGYNTSLYKVTSSKDGNLYALRRIEGFLLHDETVVFAWRRWRNVRNPNIVAAVDVFTGGAEFQDGTSSLCVITDYHPLSTTLARKHLSVKRYHGSKQVQLPDTNTLWTYVVQIANALQAIHAANLAARMLDPSKILLTDEKHVRLNVCGILDVTDRDIKSSKPDLQREDLNKFGHLISTLATGPQASKSDDLSAIYSEITKRHGDMLANRVLWLLHPQVENYTIDYFLQSIQPQVMRVLNAAMSANDELGSVLCRELENSRLVRLMTKINFVTERPEQAENTKWSEVGEWYPIKLFRDFVFHQRHQDGAPSLDLAHVMASLNKLDAGNDENIELTDEINDTNIVVSYRDLKRLVTSAFDDLKQQERRRNTTGY